MCKISTLSLVLVLCSSCPFLCGQDVDYVRLVPAGAFRTPVLWSPYNPGPNPPFLLGPGGATDDVRFNLGIPPESRYTIFDVTGVNDQLIVANDSLTLEFTGYEAVSQGDASIIVGSTDGDVADAIFTGIAGSPDLISTSAVIGLGQGSVGTVAAQGGNLTWDSECILVGESGIGTLKIMDGALVSNANAYIGVNENATGTVAVNGNSSLWFITEFLYVGAAGSGSLAISNGGEVSNTSAIIGTSGSSIGTVIVTGEDSVWTTDEQLIVGESGEGTMIVELGATATCDEGLIASTNHTTLGTGQVDVTDFESKWEIAGALTVGRNGDGILNIRNGGNVNSSTATVGLEDSSVSEITASDPGSILNIDGTLNVGDEGNGVLNIQNGGKVNSSTTKVGLQESSISAVTVSDPGSMLNSSLVEIGRQGSGRVNVQNGGSVVSFQTELSHSDDSTGVVLVDGPGSTWSNSDTFTVGEGLIPFGGESNGRLEIQNNGLVTSVRLMVYNTATISDGGQLVLTGGLGSSSSARLSISSGGSVHCTSASIGGRATVNGTESLWAIDGPLSIGNGNENAQSWLTIQDGAQVLVTDATALRLGGRLSLTDGTFGTDELTNVTGEFSWEGGTLHVGLYDSDLTNVAGTLAPGRPVGSTVIQGDYAQEQDATLEIEIGGPIVNSEHDFVDVQDNVLLDGQLELHLVNGFVPNQQQTFTVFNSAAISGFFDNVSDNQRLNTFDGAGSFLVRYGPTSPNPNQIILSDFQPNANVILGDANNDGILDNLDIAFFVLALTSLSTYQAMFPDLDPDIVLDMNNDGVFDNLDIAAFVKALVGP